MFIYNFLLYVDKFKYYQLFFLFLTLYFEYKNLRKKEKINIYMIQTCLQCIYKINLIDIKFKYTGKYSYILNA
ncbi:hypothetical protein PFBG_04344 [Plasmodium falciparum 7G8]|nr:hypothetical protein PFBG_04344 [Plasmodium falciparum 7G8]